MCSSDLDHVLRELEAAGHARPVVWLDAELEHVTEQDAPGVEALRADKCVLSP